MSTKINPEVEKLEKLYGWTSHVSIWRDSVAPCSECSGTTLSFASTITNKTYTIASAALTTEAFATNL
jgi:hypothetical protein